MKLQFILQYFPISEKESEINFTLLLLLLLLCCCRLFEPLLFEVPVVTLMVLDLVPERRGMASSFQAFIGSSANGFVAGVIAPLVMHSTTLLAATSLAMMSVGIVAWIWVKPRVT